MKLMGVAKSKSKGYKLKTTMQEMKCAQPIAS